MANRLTPQRGNRLARPTPKPTGGKLGNFAKGFGKGILRSVSGFSELGETIGRAALPKKAENFLLGEKQSKSVAEQLIPEKFTTPVGTAQKVGAAAEFVAELAIPATKLSSGAGSKLVNSARRLYQSALKPKGNTVEKAKLVETGLKEGISLTQRGVVKTGELIDNLEGKLDEAIEKAVAGGKKIDVYKFGRYIDEVKDVFKKSVDVEGASGDVELIDNMFRAFKGKYGKYVDPRVAQELKTATYKVLRKKYGQLSSASVEAQKALARGLKEGVLDVTEGLSGEVNKRLGNLYEFQTALDKASSRLGNLDVFSLGTKILTAGGGKVGNALAIANQVFGAAGKSVAAKELYRVGNILSKLDPAEIKYIGSLFNNVFGQSLGAVKTINELRK